MSKKMLLVVGLLLLAAFALTACAGEAGPAGPSGPEGPQGLQGEPGPALTAADLTCTECHNDTTLITGKEAAWEESMHGSGEAYVRGTSADCAGCHSGGGFTAMVAAGQTPFEVEAGDPNPTRQDCRTCHEIHTTYTGEDWALTTTAPVALVAFEDQTFDGGKGNLCATCHQPRRTMGPDVVDGMVNWSSTHYGPHHGPQSAMLMGIGGAGEVEGKPAAHYSMVEDTCVSCHVGDGANHSFAPSVAACQGCHADITDFDVNGTQTEVAALLTELEDALVAAGMYDVEKDSAIVGEYPEAQAAALWNYVYIAHEDKSMGVHNPAYTRALLEASIAALIP